VGLKNTDVLVGEGKNVMAAMERGLQEVASQYYNAEKRMVGYSNAISFSVGTTVVASSPTG